MVPRRGEMLSRGRLVVEGISRVTPEREVRGGVGRVQGRAGAVVVGGVEQVGGVGVVVGGRAGPRPC